MDEEEFMEPSFGELVELIKQYEDAERQNKQLFFEEETFDRIIQFYQDNREPNKALRVADAAINHYPFSSFFYSKKAEILANQKQFEEALPWLEEAERLDPNDINIFLIRADIFLWEGRHAEAMEVAEYAMSIATDPEDRSELYLEIADIWEDQEDFTGLVNSLKNAIRENPLSEEGLNRMWFCTELLESFEESIVFHQEVIDSSPYSYLAWFNLGCAYVGLKRYDEALEALGFAVAIDDEFDPAYGAMGDVFYLQEDYRTALLHYNDAVRYSAPNKELFLKVAACHDHVGDPGKARYFLRKAISVDPTFSEAFYHMGLTYLNEKNWQKATHFFERAVKLNKENLDYLMALAEAYLNMENGEKALSVFERIFQLDPESKQHWLNLATAYYYTEDYRKAFQVLHEAEQKYSHCADIYYIKSVFYNRAGNSHEALLNLEKGLMADFDKHTILFEMDEELLHHSAFLQMIEQYRA